MTDSQTDLTEASEPLLAPVTYIVRFGPSLSTQLERYAAQAGQRPETIMLEAIRVYLGDAL